MVRVVKQKMFEMALDKAKFQDVVSNLADQILQNWCLMEYCLLYGHDLVDIYDHWRSELETHLNTINRKSIKGDRKKWITEVLIKEEEFDNSDNVFGACRIKFRIENRNGLGITLEQQKEVCQHCANEIKDIINCMASDDITIYTDVRFPDL